MFYYPGGLVGGQILSFKEKFSKLLDFQSIFQKSSKKVG
jgi:hypothetical protein